jgi:hypothetical protein
VRDLFAVYGADAIGLPDAALLALFAGAGLRRSEAVAFQLPTTTPAVERYAWLARAIASALRTSRTRRAQRPIDGLTNAAATPARYSAPCAAVGISSTAR